MVISLIHPSRGRAKKSFETANKWMERSGLVYGVSGVYDEIELIIATDESDPQLKEYRDLYLLKGSPKIHGGNGLIGIGYIYTWDNKSVVEATNNAAKVARGNILIYLSDDFDCPENWGALVLKEFEGEERPLLVKVDDMLQKFDVPVLTIPIMNRALYERLKYFWHPEYKSMFVDEDLYWTTRKLGALKFAPHLKFEHQHVSIGKAPDDETYRASAKNWDQGKAVFAKRKALGFPI